jgi:hypothetical protein
MLPLWLLLTCAAVNLYLLGAAALLGRVSYPLITEAGDAAQPLLHAALNRKLGVVFIGPEFLAFLVVLPLLWLRPSGVPAWAVWLCLTLGVGYFAVTFGWHLPAHKLLPAGHAAAMQKLLVSHAVRTMFLLGKSALLLWMIARAFERSQE